MATSFAPSGSTLFPFAISMICAIDMPQTGNSRQQSPVHSLTVTRQPRIRSHHRGTSSRKLSWLQFVQFDAQARRTWKPICH
jgi:hypothetical protein